jgi:hypothetical protein
MAENEENGSEGQAAPQQEPGIVLTGTEQFGDRQGFVPASEAEAAGLTVTGKTPADGGGTNQGGDEAPKPASKKAAKKASKKGAKK